MRRTTPQTQPDGSVIVNGVKFKGRKKLSLPGENRLAELNKKLGLPPREATAAPANPTKVAPQEKKPVTETAPNSSDNAPARPQFHTSHSKRKLHVVRRRSSKSLVEGGRRSRSTSSSRLGRSGSRSQLAQSQAAAAAAVQRALPNPQQVQSGPQQLQPRRAVPFSPPTHGGGGGGSVASASASPLPSWNPLQVAAWIANTCGVPQHADKFVKEEVDGEALLALTHEDILAMGIPVGPSRKIEQRLKSIRLPETTASRKSVIPSDPLPKVPILYGSLPSDPNAPHRS